MKRQVIIFLTVVLFSSGCDALKSLYGEIYGEDDGSDGSNSSGSGSGGGDENGSGGGSGGGTRSVSAIFEGVTVDGDGTSTLVSLVFDRDISGLSEDDVTVLDPDETGAVKGVLSPAGREGIYTLGIAGVRESGEITIRVGKNGWNINPASRPAQVYYDPGAVPVTFVNIMPNGTAGSQTTTALTLTFNQTIPGLDASDITLAAGGTGAAMGTLSGPSPEGVYTLGLDYVRAEKDVTITVVKNGYTVSPAKISVPVYYQMPIPLATGGDITFLPMESDPSLIWEIHKFTKTDILAFSSGISSVTADYLIVAGGGGSGGGNNDATTDYSGGGGAGGLLYKTGETLALAGGSVPVTIGTGGTGGAVRAQGNNGAPSAAGSISVPGGGGGGGSDRNAGTGTASLDGKAGGSGGGSGAGGGAAAGNGGGVTKLTTGEVVGHRGGIASGSPGGGGGGAESAGKDADTGGGGGDPWTAEAWIQDATGTSEFSRGGRGGGSSAAGTGANYGDGGPGRLNYQSGVAGHDGIVVIRFQRSANN
jgi:hypothetical protein